MKQLVLVGVRRSELWQLFVENEENEWDERAKGKTARALLVVPFFLLLLGLTKKSVRRNESNFFFVVMWENLSCL